MTKNDESKNDMQNEDDIVDNKEGRYNYIDFESEESSEYIDEESSEMQSEPFKELNDRLKPFFWLVPTTKNRKLFWGFIIILLIIELFLWSSIFFRPL